MGYDKAEYEKLIEASQLFCLNREAEPAAYRRESYKMVEYLYCYLLAVNEKRYEPYGCEITDVAIRCINNFNASKGSFLHYFNAAWKQEFNHICGDQALDEKLHGIKITEAEKRALKRCLKYEALSGKDITCRDTYEEIGKILGYSMEDVLKIAELLDCHITDTEIADDEGNTVSLFDQLSDGHQVDENLLSQDGMLEVLTVVEQTFLSLQERQRPIVSDIMTIRVASWICEMDVSPEKYTFLSDDIIQLYAAGHILPTQRDIALKYGKNEASISRTIKGFSDKVKFALNQKG